MESFYNVWKHKATIEGIQIQGDSIAGRFSCFYLHKWKAFLDAGLHSPFSPKYIFITHTHTDHIEKLPALLTAISTFPKVYVPIGSGLYVMDYLRAHFRLSTMSNHDMTFCELIEVRPGDVIEIDGGVQVKVFATEHSIKSVGYAFSEFKNKLRREFLKLDKLQLLGKKKAGIDITERVEFPLIVYTGDTSVNVFDNRLNWNDYKVVITECTYIEEISPDIDVKELCSKNMHNSYDNILRIRNKYNNCKFVLCHWSDRYNRKQIQEFFKKNKLDNIIPWINMW